ncbi:MAG: hypothetical protein M3463_14105 [Verrucomicrobiota bacterium]|nr:hypothetical protein [Verrucomicrobiota bacterium]
MNSIRGWKIGVGLLVLFALGGVCGATFTKHRGGWGRGSRGPATDAWVERWFGQTSARLQLRDEQVATLRPIVAQMQQELHELQRETAARTADIVKQSGRQMWDVLDATQRERYRRLQQEHKLRAAVPPPQAR